MVIQLRLLVQFAIHICMFCTIKSIFFEHSFVSAFTACLLFFLADSFVVLLLGSVCDMVVDIVFTMHWERRIEDRMIAARKNQSAGDGVIYDSRQTGQIWQRARI